MLTKFSNKKQGTGENGGHNVVQFVSGTDTATKNGNISQTRVKVDWKHMTISADTGSKLHYSPLIHKQ